MGYCAGFEKLPRYYDDAETNYHYFWLMRIYLNWLYNPWAYENNIAFENYGGCESSIKWWKEHMHEDLIAHGFDTVTQFIADQIELFNEDRARGIFGGDDYDMGYYCSISRGWQERLTDVLADNQLSYGLYEIRPENIKPMIDTMIELQGGLLKQVDFSRAYVYKPDEEYEEENMKIVRRIDGLVVEFADGGERDIDSYSDYFTDLYTHKQWADPENTECLEGAKSIMVNIAHVMLTEPECYTFYYSFG